MATTAATWYLGPIFAANVTWGAFEAGFGGFHAGPNWFELDREALSFATGGGLNLGLPSANFATPFYNFSASLNVAAFLPTSQMGFSGPSLANQSGHQSNNILADYAPVKR